LVKEKMTTKAVLVPIDLKELAVLMCEAAYGITRPPDLADAGAAFDAMDKEPREGWLRAAQAAAEYLQTCCVNRQIEAGDTPRLNMVLGGPGAGRRH
jgi:hypothetical protein